MENSSRALIIRYNNKLNGSILYKCSDGIISKEIEETKLLFIMTYPNILKELIKRECKVRWYGIGTGELKEYLEAEIIRNNLAENFILLGEKENPYPYVKNANVYVQISEKEGYSISIAEAICLNKIVISTNIPVMQENIINNKTGFIVSENVEEITNILEKLIKDKEFYNKINKNIIEAKININFDKELKKLEEL